MKGYRWHINWNRKHFSLLLILFFLLLFSMYQKKSVCASDSLSENSILPMTYSDEGNTDQWPFDPRYMSNTADRTIYRDGKIYLQLYSCTYQRSRYTKDFMLRHFIRKSDGSVIWLPDQDCGAFLSDWSNVRNIMGVDLHKSFWMNPMEVPGAKPYRPSVSFSNLDNYQLHADFTGSANRAAGTYHYDYIAYHKNSHKESFVPDEGVAMDATDYLTGFYYQIDENENNISLQNFHWLSSSDFSGNTRSLGLDIPSEYVNTARQYYLHLCARSYTGQISDMMTVSIPRRGIHTIHYDLNGGSGNFPDQTVIYGKKTYLHPDKPSLEGSTFMGWKGPEGILQPKEFYRGNQDGGVVTLKAEWEENRYRIIYHANDKGGQNGQISGDMPAEDKVWSSIGIADNAFINQSKQKDGRDQYLFQGWSFQADSFTPDLSFNPGDSTWSSKIRIRDLAKALGIQGESGKEIHLYAVWDQAPYFEGKDEFFLNHKPTQIELLQLIKAYDREDSPDTPLEIEEVISSQSQGWQREAAGKVRLLDFCPEEFDGFSDCGWMTLTYRAEDSAGNITDHTIRIWLLSDSALKERGGKLQKQAYIRFIDGDNYRKDYAHGGLRENSVWRLDLSYRTVLDRLFTDTDKNKKS
ncbi:InlB B-repeat-containing protein [Lachnospiraceae bacterium YH-ros2226]